MPIDIINKEEIDWSALNGIDNAKFSQWPVEYVVEIYNISRLNSIDPAKVVFLAYTSSGTIKSILEVHLNEYDTKRWGFSCCSIINLFFSSSISDEEKPEAVNELLNYFLKYRQKERLRFCFWSISNHESSISLSAQGNGFKYILTWGSCFIDETKDLRRTSELNISNEKKEEWMVRYLDMIKYYFKGGRFYLDGHFNNATVDKMYEDLIVNCFESNTFDFFTLLDKLGEPLCFIISKRETLQFRSEFRLNALRFLLGDKSRLPKGTATSFFNSVSNLLVKDAGFVTSGIEIHNMPSLAIHNKCGYNFNYVYSAYHSFLK